MTKRSARSLRRRLQRSEVLKLKLPERGMGRDAEPARVSGR